ncbi:MAG: hypothetical protein FD119_2822 [Stygiobacter sp.]|nr:MAG: hypothetical protein FD119_2822 [Stygiobacter sp.]
MGAEVSVKRVSLASLHMTSAAPAAAASSPKGTCAAPSVSPVVAMRLPCLWLAAPPLRGIAQREDIVCLLRFFC